MKLSASAASIHRAGCLKEAIDARVVVAWIGRSLNRIPSADLRFLSTPSPRVKMNVRMNNRWSTIHHAGWKNASSISCRTRCCVQPSSFFHSNFGRASVLMEEADLPESPAPEYWSDDDEGAGIESTVLASKLAQELQAGITLDSPYVHESVDSPLCTQSVDDYMDSIDEYRVSSLVFVLTPTDYEVSEQDWAHRLSSTNLANLPAGNRNSRTIGHSASRGGSPKIESSPSLVISSHKPPERPRAVSQSSGMNKRLVVSEPTSPEQQPNNANIQRTLTSPRGRTIFGDSDFDSISGRGALRRGTTVKNISSNPEFKMPDVKADGTTEVFDISEARAQLKKSRSLFWKDKKALHQEKLLSLRAVNMPVDDSINEQKIDDCIIKLLDPVDGIKLTKHKGTKLVLWLRRTLFLDMNAAVQFGQTGLMNRGVFHSLSSKHQSFHNKPDLYYVFKFHEPKNLVLNNMKFHLSEVTDPVGLSVSLVEKVVKILGDPRHTTIDGKFDFTSASRGKEYIRLALLSTQLQAVRRRGKLAENSRAQLSVMELTPEERTAVYMNIYNTFYVQSRLSNPELKNEERPSGKRYFIGMTEWTMEHLTEAIRGHRGAKGPIGINLPIISCLLFDGSDDSAPIVPYRPEDLTEDRWTTTLGGYLKKSVVVKSPRQVVLPRVFEAILQDYGSMQNLLNEIQRGGTPSHVTSDSLMHGFTQFEAPANHFLLGTQSSNLKAIQPQQRWNILSRISAYGLTTSLASHWNPFGSRSLHLPHRLRQDLQWTDHTGSTPSRGPSFAREKTRTCPQPPPTTISNDIRPTTDGRCTASSAFGQKTWSNPFEGLYEEGRRVSDEAVVYGVWPYPAQSEADNSRGHESTSLEELHSFRDSSSGSSRVRSFMADLSSKESGDKKDKSEELRAFRPLIWKSGQLTVNTPDPVLTTDDPKTDTLEKIENSRRCVERYTEILAGYVVSARAHGPSRKTWEEELVEEEEMEKIMWHDELLVKKEIMTTAGKRESLDVERSEVTRVDVIEPVAATTVIAEPLNVKHVEKDVVVHEHIHPVEKEEIQPIIHREREQMEVRQITERLHETEIQPTLIEKRELAPEVREVMVERSAPISENIILPSVSVDTTLRSVETHAPIVNEVIKKTVIEEVQPVLEKDVIVPTIIQETKPIYEKIVEASVLIREELPVREVTREKVIIESGVLKGKASPLIL
ncbi:hypothetical protein PROFUN_09165 [Planoprotostelium fungivorum]|uniref:DUF547 domain-containing protein n=1 Tax=Planoprotostelium fungivorum TaxID=1890364 RepID=A0A2P6MVK0_9EUKA|nr:hypothetical protein PROFUN_09165 [Planoprotostelium fungivorum]